VLEELKAAGAKQVAPFGGTISTPRPSIVYSLLEGLPPNAPDAAAGYRTDSFGLHVAKGTTETEIAEMGKKYGFSLEGGRFREDGRPNCYVTLTKGKALAEVLTSLLTAESRVVTVNLNYFDR
jgi:hypothetical protein